MEHCEVWTLYLNQNIFTPIDSSVNRNMWSIKENKLWFFVQSRVMVENLV